MKANLTSRIRAFKKEANGAHRDSRRGFVLVAVLIVVMLLSMVAVSLMFRLKAEDMATAAGAGSEQAWMAAMSGVQEAMRLGSQAKSGSSDWYLSPGLFRDRLVLDDGAEQWFFRVYSAQDLEGRDEVRYGLTDESGKLNVNVATETNLLRLPGMTRPLAEAIIDFIDDDDVALTDGAEQEYYDGLPSGYRIPNGPISVIDELLLVRGFSPALLDGEDVNRNFIMDPNENDGDQSYPPDNNDSKLDLGLRQFLTVSSYEPDVDNEGVPRTILNDPDDPLPKADLPAAVTNYILALRTNGIAVEHPADLLEARTKVKDASGKEVEIESGVGKNELPMVLDLFTTASEVVLKGLINANTATAEVLAAVPEIDPPLAESIVSARRGIPAEKRKTTAWLYTEGLVPADLFKKIAPYLTARSLQFSFHAVGYGLPSGRYRVLEVVVDCAGEKPAILSLRDLTKLGMPFRIEPEQIAMPMKRAQNIPLKGGRRV